MTSLTFHPATKAQAKARVALSGPSGSGKTFTALIIASELGERVAVIDTEHGSASKYADLFDFSTLELDRFDPRTYVQAIQLAAADGFDVLVIDSMSHEWEGVGGVLELHDRATAEDKSKNSFAAWRKVTPLHNAFIEAIIAAPMHVIGTMRSKAEYSVEGKTVTKVGTAPKQRDGVEYEFDVVADLELDNTMRVTKSRCPQLHRATFSPATGEVATTLRAWLSDGKPAPVQESGEVGERGAAEVGREAAGDPATIQAGPGGGRRKGASNVHASAANSSEPGRFPSSGSDQTPELGPPGSGGPDPEQREDRTAAPGSGATLKAFGEVCKGLGLSGQDAAQRLREGGWTLPQAWWKTIDRWDHDDLAEAIEYLETGGQDPPAQPEAAKAS